LHCVRSFAGQGKKPTLLQHSERLPERGAFFVRQSDKFIDEYLYCWVLSAEDMGQRCAVQRVHQRGGVADLARIIERVLRVCERGLGITKHPQGKRPKGQDRHPDVLAKSRRQRTMLGRIVKRDRLIVVRPAFRDVSPLRS
jgi:hypothetical protein